MVVLTSLMAWSAGCANLRAGNQADILRFRVEKLLNAKVAGDWGTVYDLLDPVFRQKVSKNGFLNRPKNTLFKGFKIKELELMPSGKEARVKVTYDISMRGFDFKDAPEVQHWVFEEGRWYLKMKPHLNPFKNK